MPTGASSRNLKNLLGGIVKRNKKMGNKAPSCITIASISKYGSILLEVEPSDKIGNFRCTEVCHISGVLED
jgi:hypothetical protein